PRSRRPRTAHRDHASRPEARQPSRRGPVRAARTTWRRRDAHRDPHRRRVRQAHRCRRRPCPLWTERPEPRRRTPSWRSGATARSSRWSAVTAHRPRGIERRCFVSTDLDPLLKRLHLANTRRVWRELVQRAEKEEWSFEAFLQTLVAEEIAH